LADQAVRFMAASEAKHELERRVADEGSSLSNLYAAAQALETLDIDRLYPAIPQTARRFLQADACQLYLLDGDVLRLRAAEGAPPPLTEINPGEGLAGLAIRQGKAQSLRDLMTISTADELQLAPFVMAAPRGAGARALARVQPLVARCGHRVPLRDGRCLRGHPARDGLGGRGGGGHAHRARDRRLPVRALRRRGPRPRVHRPRAPRAGA